MVPTNHLIDVAPDLAHRAHALATRGLPEKLAGLSAFVTDDDDLPLELPLHWERNRARKTALSEWTKLIAGARMTGDERLATAAQRAADRQCVTGARWPDLPLAAGVQVIALHAIARWSTPMTTGDLNMRGYEPPVGPRLAESPWPEILVTKARSLDGSSLDLALRRVQAAPGRRIRLAFDQLRSGARYRLVDAVGTQSPQLLVADAAGAGAGEVVPAAEGPTVVRLEPEAAS